MRRTALVLALSLVGTHHGQSQTIGAVCTALDRHALARTMTVPPFRDYQRQLISALTGHEASETPENQVTALWAADSLSVLWSLSAIVAHPDQVGSMTTRAAALLYKAHQGPAAMMLVGQLEGQVASEVSASDALEALTPPLQPVEEAAVFALTCDAAWLLNALAQDPAYRLPYQPTARIGWAGRAASTLRQGARLLRGPHRPTVLRWIDALKARGVLIDQHGLPDLRHAD